MNWKFWKRRKKLVRIILATRDEEALAALDELEAPYKIVAEAITCDGLYRALGHGADLVIADLGQLASRQLSPQGIGEIISSSNIPLATPTEFAADPHLWGEAALAAKGDVRHLPSTFIAITSYSGGVGKTTIALDMASLFAQRTNLPTLVAEFVMGESALRAICNPNAPSLYDCITEGKELAKWRGVDILPMNYTLARMLEAPKIVAYLRDARSSHVLLVADGTYSHPLLRPVLDEVRPDVWLMVGTPKPDALSNLQRLAGEINSNKKVIINMVRGRLSLVGVEKDFTFPFIEAPERYDGRLGGKALKLVYPHWR